MEDKRECRTCGCDWLPCAQRGECLDPWAFRWWVLMHPLAYRKDKARWENDNQ